MYIKYRATWNLILGHTICNIGGRNSVDGTIKRIWQECINHVAKKSKTVYNPVGFDSSSFEGIFLTSKHFHSNFHWYQLCHWSLCDIAVLNYHIFLLHGYEDDDWIIISIVNINQILYDPDKTAINSLNRNWTALSYLLDLLDDKFPSDSRKLCQAGAIVSRRCKNFTRHWSLSHITY